VKKQPTKVKPHTKLKTQDIYTDLLFHQVFPITLNFKNDPEKKVCCFQCQEHLNTYLKRHNLKKKDYTISKTKSKNEEA
jgi:hypothetical protein